MMTREQADTLITALNTIEAQRNEQENYYLTAEQAKVSQSLVDFLRAEGFTIRKRLISRYTGEFYISENEEREEETNAKARLEYLRSQLQAECISWYELAELRDLAEHIDPGDVELLQWAGVPEFPDEEG